VKGEQLPPIQLRNTSHRVKKLLELIPLLKKIRRYNWAM